MLELDNLDLDFDDDFPTGTLTKINSFESSFSKSLSYNGRSIEGTETSHKSVRSSQDSVKADFDLSKSSDSVEKSEQDKKISLKKVHEVGSKSQCSFLSDSGNCKNVIKFDENELNPLNDTSTNKRILSHRKFPGPAGLLPDKPLKDLSDINIILDDSAENVKSERQQESVILCSQSSSVSSQPAYKKLAADFDLFEEKCPLNKYNIAWVKKKALQKSSKGKKIPFLAVVLHHLDHSTPDPVLKLMDQTGEIYGILHREVWSDLGGKLHPGAALALRQVGVLITCISKKQIYLNITVNNIVNIYSYSNADVLEKSCINVLKKSDLMKDIELWQTETSILKTDSPPKPFSTVGSSKVNHPILSLVKDSKCTAGSKICENKNSPHPNLKRLCSTNILQENKLNNLLQMDDDISDFMDSLDEDTIFGEVLKETKNSDFNGIGKSEKYESNCRKRKIESDDKNRPNTNESRPTENSSSLPPAKLGKMKCQEKLIKLNQVENEIAKEALDGIDLDDFNFFDDFEI